jgi:hypothetical protein
MAGLRFGELLHLLLAFIRLRQQPHGRGGQQTTAVFQFVGAMAVGQQAVVPDALETGRQSMDEKAPLELLDFEGQASCRSECRCQLEP